MKNILDTLFNRTSHRETVNWSVLKSDASRNRNNPVNGNSADDLTYSSVSGDLHDRLKKEFHSRMKSMNQPASHSNLFQ